MGVSIVIPAYNEEKRIIRTLDDYERLIGRVKDLRIIVTSESNDSTNRIVAAHSKRHREISLISDARRRGKGAAVAAGFRRALRRANGKDVIGFVDADDSVNSEQFLKLLEAIDSYDCIIGSRYVEGSRISGKVKARRLVASRTYNALVKALFGLHYNDTQCGAKLFRADALRGILPRVTVSGLGFDVNMLYELKLDGKRIKEYPIKYFVKNSGTSVTVAQVLEMFFSTIGYRLARGNAHKRSA